jgi:hypothetical protein
MHAVDVWAVWHLRSRRGQIRQTRASDEQARKAMRDKGQQPTRQTALQRQRFVTSTPLLRALLVTALMLHVMLRSWVVKWFSYHVVRDA